MKISVWVILLILYTINSPIALAQCPTSIPAGYIAGGGFNLPTQTCQNTTIRVNSQGGLSNQKYVYNYKSVFDLPSATTITTNSYSTLGKFAVVQTATDRNGKNTWVCHEITVNDTPKPDFEITTCDNAVVMLKLKVTGSVYNNYTVDWGDGSTKTTFSSPSTLPIHLYKDNSTYSISVSGGYLSVNCGQIAIKSVVPLGVPLKMPIITKTEIIDKNTAELTVSNPSNLPVDLLQSRNNNSNYQKATGTITINNGIWKYRVSNLQTDQFAYAFELKKDIICRDIIGVNHSASLFSNEAGIFPLQITLLNYQNNLFWRNYPITMDLKGYQIYRDGLLINSPSAGSTFYSDRTPKCGQKVKYQVVAISRASNAGISYSIPIDTTTLPNTTPTKLSDIVVSVVNNQVLITINDNLRNERIMSYLLYRFNGKDFEKIKSATSKTFLDTQMSGNDSSACYKVSYQNICNKIAPMPDTICTTFVRNDGGQTLNWNTQLPFSDKLNSYTVEKVDLSGNVLDIYDAQQNNKWIIDTQDPQQEVSFRISVLSKKNQRVSLSNVIKVVKPMKAFIPNSFTPNGDAEHQKFEMAGIYLNSAKIFIYNRLGSLIYNSEGFLKTGWDGTLNDGTVAPLGIYSYLIESTDTLGNIQANTGDIFLIK